MEDTKDELCEHNIDDVSPQNHSKSCNKYQSHHSEKHDAYSEHAKHCKAHNNSARQKDQHISQGDALIEDEVVCDANGGSYNSEKHGIFTDSSKESVELQVERAKFAEQVLRAKAESENLRKRYEREIIDVKRYAIANFALDITETVENLYKARAHIVGEESLPQQVRPLVEGIDLTIKSLEKILEKHKVRRVLPSTGDVFDHHYHQAISSVQSEEIDDKQSNIITDVVRAGYMLDDRLLRPALVIVSV